MIHLITNDDWLDMAQCSIIDLSPPTPPRIGFNPPSVGGFFLAKISVSERRMLEAYCVDARVDGYRYLSSLRTAEAELPP